MPPKIETHPAAIREARKAYRWYLRRSATAAKRFEAAIEAAIAQIAQFPERWPVYLYGTRYRLLRRFPFVVIYRITEGSLQIVAIAHGSRRPGYWRKRRF